jgi:hypothetical protein
MAVFVGIAEVSGTVVLPFVSTANQTVHVWFLIGFPTLLVVLFFATLNFNHKVLYAPSDVEDEENFFRDASPGEKAEKLKQEVCEAREEVSLTANAAEAAGSPLAARSDPVLRTSEQAWPFDEYEYRSRHILAETFVLERLSKELHEPVRRDVGFDTSDAQRYLFDGIVTKGERVTAIEFQFIWRSSYASPSMGTRARQVQAVWRAMPPAMQREFSLILAIAVDSVGKPELELAEMVNRSMGKVPFPVDVRFFDVRELFEEAGLVR